MSCKFAGRTEPRVLPGRHGDECQGRIVTEGDGPGDRQYVEGCAGCLECPEPHCRVCNMAHADQTCAECLATTRGELHSIARMCSALPEEVEHRGIDGEAMMLLGPAADYEARGHLEASVLAGRVPADYFDQADGELHPLFVLGGWDAVWRDALEHDEQAGHVTIATTVDYLDRTLTYMAGYEHVPFEDFAKDLRRCAAHLESVLHDGEQVDTGAPCMTCNVPLERVWGADETSDGWKCPRCRERSTDDQYRFAVAHLHREEATHLTDRDMEIRTGVKAGTVRSWARRGLIGKRQDSGRVLYAVTDVETRAGVRVS